MGYIIAVVFLSFLLPVIYGAISPVYNIYIWGINTTYTMAASPIPVALAHQDIVPGSEIVTNATNSTAATIGEGFGSATDCGADVVGENDCYYNFTDGNAYTYGTLVVNQTGDVNITYRYYPEGYSKQTQDRSIVVFITTFLIIGVLFAIGKGSGLF